MMKIKDQIKKPKIINKTVQSALNIKKTDLPK